ncbi:hypothetical protein [Puniceibacterium confluentis]|uniref:hypothetical protein n=1 Tax=Puniceibacterium confluentis TaxID=1958944 RepID=UPI0011B761AF|nr:hypothetical protein [Puniceibacterium confluentis]
MELRGLLVGSFSYLGADAFSAHGATEARFDAGVVIFDFDGNGTADMSIRLTGFVDATQLTTDAFLFI